MADFVLTHIVDALQQHGIRILRAAQADVVAPALADMRHMGGLGWQPEHLALVWECIETLTEILEDVDYPVTRMPQPKPWTPPPLDNSDTRSAFEAIARDDVATLLYLLDDAGLTPDTCASAPDARVLHWVRPGETLLQVASRMDVVWCSRLLAHAGSTSGRSRKAAALRPNPAARVLEEAEGAGMRRRGSYSVMRKDFARRRNDNVIQLLIHFPDDQRVVGYSVAAEKKARHVVYELAEAYQLDLEAFSLQRSSGDWIEDYRSLSASGVRSGEELWIVLKHKALHQLKHFHVRVVLVLASGEQRSIVVAVDPFMLIATLHRLVVERIREARESMGLILPISLASGSLGGVWLDKGKTLSTYGLTECAEWLDSPTRTLVPRPILMGWRESVPLYPVATLREVDPRMERWLEIVSHFADYTQGLKRTELRAALLLGVPSCLRGRIWELLLFGKAYETADAQAAFAELVDRERLDDASERVDEQISNDIDRTMPYHPMFRDKCGHGQATLQRVLRAYAMRDPTLGYCQGMNFIVATLLGSLSPEAALAALTLLMERFRLRANFTSGMIGLHEMLDTFDKLVRREMPELHQWMAQQSIICASFASEWFLTLFSSATASSSSSDDVTARIWDVFLESGTPFLYKVGLTVLSMKQSDMVAQPEDAIEIIKSALHGINVNDLVSRAAALKFSIRP